MLNRILINILSAVIYLVCSAFFLMIFNCDIFFFLTWSLPLTVGIAISGQRLIYFCKNSKGGNRLLIILIIASVISIIWLYAFFSLWDSQQDMFKMPLIFLFIVCSFIQLVFIDRVKKKLSEEKQEQSGIKIQSCTAPQTCLPSHTRMRGQGLLIVV